MGKGLSPLQKNILAVLEQFPAAPPPDAEGNVSLKTWARPQQILQQLNLPSTPSNRASNSHRLLRTSSL
jgi:hypothetical protein